MVGGSVLIVLAVAALVVALTSGSNSTPSGSALPTGLDLATIHIVVPRNGSPTFSGTVGDMALTGTVSVSTPATSGTLGTFPVNGSLPLNTVTFAYRGDLAGTPYLLHVALDLASAGAALQNGRITFDVTGTYGSERVTGTANFVIPSTLTPSSLTSPSQTVNFSGHIGSQVIGGTATATQNGSGTYDVTASVTVAP